MAESIKQQTISSVKWTAIEKFGLQGMQFVLGLIMARLLTPSDYGAIGMIAIFLAISNSFIDSGFGTALIRKQNRTETDFSTVFYFNIVVAVLCYGILFVIAPWVGEFFKTPILCPILRVQSINLLLNSLMQIQVAKLTIDLDFKALAKRSILATLVSGVLGVIMAYNGFGVWSLVAQSLMSSVINFVFIWIYCKWTPLWFFSWQSFKELFGFGSKLLASGLLHTLYINMTTFVIGKFYTSKDLGFYNRGTQFAHMPVDTLNSIIGKVTFPILARIQDDNKHLIRVYRRYIRIMSLCIFFPCTLLAALAKPVIGVLLTDKWIESVIFLQIYSFAIMFDHISKVNLNLLQVKGRSDLFLRLEIVKKTIAILILFASIPFGVIAICLSKILYSQIAIFINTYYTGKLFQMGYFSQVIDYIPYFFYSLIACIPAFALTYTTLPYIVIVMIGGVASTSLYCYILRHDENLIEILNIVTSKIHIRKC